MEGSARRGDTNDARQTMPTLIGALGRRVRPAALREVIGGDRLREAAGSEEDGGQEELCGEHDG